MALPTSPPITLRQIANEFQSGGVVYLTDFYRGGGRVPNIPQNSNVPTSGTISLLDFLGATNQPPLSGTLSGLSGQYVDPLDPFPLPSRTVTATPGANPSGGAGGYTYQWSITSGTASITSSSTLQTITISALVNNHSTVTGGIRCIISSGGESVTLNGTYSLYYSGGQPG